MVVDKQEETGAAGWVTDGGMILIRTVTIPTMADRLLVIQREVGKETGDLSRTVDHLLHIIATEITLAILYQLAHLILQKKKIAKCLIDHPTGDGILLQKTNSGGLFHLDEKVQENLQERNMNKQEEAAEAIEDLHRHGENVVVHGVAARNDHKLWKQYNALHRMIILMLHRRLLRIAMNAGEVAAVVNDVTRSATVGVTVIGGIPMKKVMVMTLIMTREKEADDTNMITMTAIPSETNRAAVRTANGTVGAAVANDAATNEIEPLPTIREARGLNRHKSVGIR